MCGGKYTTNTENRTFISRIPFRNPDVVLKSNWNIYNFDFRITLNYAKLMLVDLKYRKEHGKHAISTYATSYLPTSLNRSDIKVKFNATEYHM